MFYMKISNCIVLASSFLLSGCFFIDNLKCSLNNTCVGYEINYVNPEIKVRLGVLNSLPQNKNLKIGIINKKDIEVVRTTPFVKKFLKQNGYKVSSYKERYNAVYSLENKTSHRQRPVYGSTGIQSVTPTYSGGYNVSQGYGIVGFETVTDYDTCFYLSIIDDNVGEVYRSYLCFETVPLDYKKYTYEYIGEIYSRYLNIQDGTETFLCSKNRNSRGNFCEKEEMFYEFNQVKNLSSSNN